MAVAEAGAIALVLKMAPVELAARVTKFLQIPTISIGAGPHCDRQILIWTNTAATTSWSPRFARRYAELGNALREAAAAYADDVRSGGFPGAKPGFEA